MKVSQGSKSQVQTQGWLGEQSSTPRATLFPRSVGEYFGESRVMLPRQPKQTNWKKLKAEWSFSKRKDYACLALLVHLRQSSPGTRQPLKLVTYSFRMARYNFGWCLTHQTMCISWGKNWRMISAWHSLYNELGEWGVDVAICTNQVNGYVTAGLG